MPGLKELKSGTGYFIEWLHFALISKQYARVFLARLADQSIGDGLMKIEQDSGCRS
jgi:hypothetical protein